MITTYTVRGMTCDHCTVAVASEVSAVAGVTNAHVDLAASTLTVTSSDALDDAAVLAAVEEAGYQAVC